MKTIHMPPPETRDPVDESTEAELEKAINRAVVPDKQPGESEDLDKMLDQIIENGQAPASQKPRTQAQAETKSAEREDADIDGMLNNLDKK